MTDTTSSAPSREHGLCPQGGARTVGRSAGHIRFPAREQQGAVMETTSPKVPQLAPEQIRRA
ncbi:hypothetical protein ACFV1C_40290, partial [Streptomyces sp. NPDC059605]|uniref:hypothetical protein n=1 Tax=Streptomyces sp. NPDC059605 TaxID=3346882 RepID=UPI0036CAC509